MGLFRNITKSIGKIAPIAIPAMIGFGFGGGSAAGIGSFFSNMSTAQKLGLGVGALAWQEAWASDRSTTSRNALNLWARTLRLRLVCRMAGSYS